MKTLVDVEDTQKLYNYIISRRKKKNTKRVVLKGGPGSGFHGHAGLPGVWGGSRSAGSAAGSTSKPKKVTVAKKPEPPKETKTPDAFSSNQKEWEDSLSSSEKRALMDYTDDMYHRMNSRLREGKDIGDLKSELGAMDAALSRNELPSDAKLYRGFRYDDLYNSLKSKSVRSGDVISDSAFMSTSSKKARALGGNIQMTINAPKGTKGGYLDNVSTFQGEGEFLLPRNTSLQINSVSLRGGVAFVTATVVNNG